MPKKGPHQKTLIKLDRAMILVGKGEKIQWSLTEVGLSTQSWYKWVGWKRFGSYKRDTYARRDVIDRLFVEATKLVKSGVYVKNACKKVGLSYDTFWFRKKKQK